MHVFRIYDPNRKSEIMFHTSTVDGQYTYLLSFLSSFMFLPLPAVH